ncbi:MAG: K(+)-transporting ATPase subunit F [Solirubrobacteraceae bacterium]|nr:K(+)-transporting ATPase subunit F [Solirubrobacteraceae bacterium]
MPTLLLALTGGNAAGLLAAVLLLGYLVYALVRAERF